MIYHADFKHAFQAVIRVYCFWPRVKTGVGDDEIARDRLFAETSELHRRYDFSRFTAPSTYDGPNSHLTAVESNQFFRKFYFSFFFLKKKRGKEPDVCDRRRIQGISDDDYSINRGPTGQMDQPGTTATREPPEPSLKKGSFARFPQGIFGINTTKITWIFHPFYTACKADWWTERRYEYQIHL